MWGQWEVPELRQLTTASLSQLIEAYPKGTPPTCTCTCTSPDTGRQNNEVEFFPLYAEILLFLGPLTLEPLPLAVGTKADGTGAVCV